MKITEILKRLSGIASPLVLILAGLILMVNPDVAAVLISRLLGWVLTLVGIGFGIAAIVDHSKAISRGLTSVGLVCAGGFLTAKPLLLAALAGKLLGILILLRGLRDLFLAQSRGYGYLPAGILAAVGAVLILLPMTASRLVISACGLGILAAGAWLLWERIRNRQLPPDRPDIIDAL